MRRITSILILALTLIVEPATARPLRQGGPQPIAYGQTASGDLTTLHPENLYIFAAQQGDSITVTMDAVEGNLYPLVILVDESQQTVIAVGNAGGTKQARLRFIIPAAANYIIRATAVQGSGDLQGKYRLELILGNPTPTPSPVTNTAWVSPLQPGETVQGDLSDAVRFHLYSLRLKQGDAINVMVEIGEGGVQAGLYLYGADFHEIARAELGQPLNMKAPADGLYFLMVARAATSGAGGFTLKQAGNSAAGISIGLGKTVRGAITAADPVKTYSLQGNSGQMIIARMRRLSGDLAVYLYVVAIDDGKTLAQAGGEGGVAELSTVLPANGFYAIVATRDGKQSGTTTGEYSLTVEPPGQSAPLPPAFQGYTPIQYGSKVSGAIDNTAFARPYVFAAEAGDVIQATLTAEDGNLDPYLILQNATGNTVAEIGNEGRGTAHLQTTLAQAGYYALVATRAGFAAGQSTGKFALILSVGESAGDAVHTGDGIPLIAGQAQTATVGAQVGSLFRFEAQDNTAVSLDVIPSAGLEVVTILADSNFQEIAKAATGPIRTTLLPHAGTYYVLVMRRGGPNDAGVGTYAITLQGTVNPAPTAAPGTLVYGQPVAGTISGAAYQVRYTFSAKQGTTIAVTMEAAPGSTLDPMVALLDSSNNLLIVNDNASNTNKNAALIYDVVQDGQYTVLATRAQEAAGTTSGGYILKVDVRQPATSTAISAPTAAPVAATSVAPATTAAPATGPQVRPIQYGATVQEVIGAGHFLYYYSFQGNAGGVITIRMSRAGGSNLDPLLYFYAYSGSPTLLAAIRGNPDASIVKFRLPQTGPYLIAATRVGAAQGQTEGGFSLTLVRDG